MRAFLAAMLFALCGPAGAQAQAPATPAPQQLERGTSGESKLNLNLDDASRRQILRDMPTERGAPSPDNALPGLGATRGNGPSTIDLNDKRPFPRTGLDPPPTAPPPPRY